MSEKASSDGASLEAAKPAQILDTDDVIFPPLPEPTDWDFDVDVGEEEKDHYKSKFPDLKAVVKLRLHCTACDRHLGCSVRNESRMRSHPMLKTLICHACHSFYNSGEFDKGEDGSELYCRWCGQGGQVYCCSDCIHVFCAKCIKRNFGVGKIKEIENTDDWKCFKCNPKSLWDLRAVCWALLRFCEFRNKIVDKTTDSALKEKYQKLIYVDATECCRNKGRRSSKTDVKKKETNPVDVAKKIISKIPPTIQVKKFASVNMDESCKNEKKAQKRPASPKIKIANTNFMPKPVNIAPCNLITAPIMKKMRLPTTPLLTPVRYSTDKKIMNTYTPRFTTTKPRQHYPIPIVNANFNGFNNVHDFNNSHTMPSSNIAGDNINLSLETLTQGLDLASFNNNSADNSLVCTPDLLEPLCEVYEDNDDDVECITPGPVAPPKLKNPPPLISRTLPDLSADNIVQMTENDVTVNAVTGGLKFRVDPQTLSSKKMYRLPDGRIFAINPNPNMPGGYSATIVSVSECTGKIAPKSGETFSAKLSTVTPSPKPSQNNTNVKTSQNSNVSKKYKTKSPHRSKSSSTNKNKDLDDSNRQSDFKVPVEWYRYNLIDAVDALGYSLSRLNKLKKEATTAHLRTRNIVEMKYLHRTLEQLLSTSSKRFLEIRDNLNKELKQYIAMKSNTNNKNRTDLTEEDDDDDDVEILPDGNDDPIFIDENSTDSANDTQEVDLTGAGSSEHNDSSENKNYTEPLICHEQLTEKNQELDKTNDQSSSETESVKSSSIIDRKVSSENKKSNDNQDDSFSNSMVNDTTVDSVDDDAEKKSEQGCFKENTRDEDKEKLSNDNTDDEEKSSNEKKDDAKKSSNSTKDFEEKTSDSIEDEKESDLKGDEEKSLESKKGSEEKISDKNEDSQGTKTVVNDSSIVQKSNETNGELNDVVHNDEAMEVDGQLELKDIIDQNDDKTFGPDMSDELINTLLEEGDTLESVDNVLKASSLDISDGLEDK